MSTFFHICMPRKVSFYSLFFYFTYRLIELYLHPTSARKVLDVDYMFCMVLVRFLFFGQKLLSSLLEIIVFSLFGVCIRTRDFWFLFFCSKCDSYYELISFVLYRYSTRPHNSYCKGVFLEIGLNKWSIQGFFWLCRILNSIQSSSFLLCFLCDSFLVKFLQ